ncbi:MAG: pantetheine-phosphate adenylyltransferase [Patescibacteria group bacterium]
MTQRTAVYAGSFDPLTNGHMWMVEQGAKLFDQLILAIGVNPGKKCAFSLDDRFSMLAQLACCFPNVNTDIFPNEYLIHYARKKNARFILRGVRTESDFEYERGMRNVNGDMVPGITTIFLIPPREIVEISSSMVKGLVGPEGWEAVVKKMVPEPVFKKLQEAHRAKKES